MAIREEQVKEQFTVKKYKVQYPISAHTFPREAFEYGLTSATCT
jgi:hypothetical protein